MPLWARSITKYQMTTSLVASEFVSELVADQPSSVDMMIGIGLVKDTDAVYFQYLGEEQSPSALMLPSGKPCTRLPHVTLTGIEIAEDIGEFNSTKLNLFVTSNAGRTVMLTSGLQTIWSQCIITALMGVFGEYALDAPMTIDTWKGTSKMRPCFAAIRQGPTKMSDTATYEALKDARSDRNKELVERIMRDSVALIQGALGIEHTSVQDVTDVATESVDESELF
tara:strand:+ start:202 stop:876 length:675 start_codon:yes stop_codon:yes gene_type:complete